MALVLEARGLTADEFGALEEGEEYLKRSLEIRRARGDRLGMATCLKYLSWAPTLHLGHFERAERYARESLAIRQELLGAPGDGLEVLGWAIAHRGRYEEAYSMIEESAAGFEGRGARFGHFIASIFLGVVEAHLGRYLQVYDRGQACLDTFRSIGTQAAIAFFIATLGMAALGVGKAEDACQLLEESVSIYQESNSMWHRRWAFAFPGYAAHKLGHLYRAQQCFGRVLRLSAESRSLWALLYTLPGVAALLADRGKAERAVEIYALAACYPFVANSRWFEDVAGKDIAAAAEALPPEVVAAAQARGRAADPWVVTEELLRELDE
jgi:tetratricopeptide (TPR) repeat protein